MIALGVLLVLGGLLSLVLCLETTYNLSDGAHVAWFLSSLLSTAVGLFLLTFYTLETYA